MRNGVSSALGRGAGGGDQQLRLVALAPAARCSVASRSAMTRSAGRGAVVGQAVPAGQGQHLDLGREQRRRCRRARASPLRRRRSRPRGRLARAVRRAREIGGEPRQEARSARRRASAARRREGRAAAARVIARSGCSRASSAPRSSALRSAPAASAVPMRPGHDVDVLLLEHRLEQRALVRAPTTRGARRRTRRSADRLPWCRDDARARRGASGPGRKAWRSRM